MVVNILKSKIHRAVVTEANIEYVGSVTIDEALMEAAGLHEYELVHVVDLNNGSRFQTYVIRGQRGSGAICLNGAAARLVYVGDRVIIMAFCLIEERELSTHRPRVVFVDEKNMISGTSQCEKHGEIR